MKKLLHDARWVGLVVGLAVVLTPLLMTARSVRAQETGPVASPVAVPAAADGSITIAALMCPEEYAGDDFQADCTEIPPDGTAFYIFRQGTPGEAVPTDGDGIAVVPLPAADTPGSVVLSYTLPGRYHSVVSAVSCVNDVGAQLPVDDGPGSVTLEVAADGAVVNCAWYLIPDRLGPGDPATVTFVNLLCPPGYEGEDYAEDCVMLAGAGKQFTVVVQVDPQSRVGVSGETGPDGVVTIGIPYAHAVLPGTIYVGQSIDPRGDQDWDDLLPFVVACSRNDGAEAIPVAEDGPNSVAIEALVDDGITCIWYNLPPADDEPTPTPTVTATPDPSVTPTRTPSPTATPAATETVVTLPNTGTGG